MQDPIFNVLDAAFLQELGYTVLPPPQAIEKLTPATFLFAPHLEWPFYIQALQTALPALCIGNNVREYLDHGREAKQQGERETLLRFLEKTNNADMPAFDRATWCTSTTIYWRNDERDED